MILTLQNLLILFSFSAFYRRNFKNLHHPMHISVPVFIDCVMSSSLQQRDSQCCDENTE